MLRDSGEMQNPYQPAKRMQTGPQPGNWGGGRGQFFYFSVCAHLSEYGLKL